MGPCIWYVSKYVTPPSKGSAGGRGYLIMREIAKRGIPCVIVTSDANCLGDIPENKAAYDTEEEDGLTIRWVRTFKYSVAKSWRRIVSWLSFEWRLFLMPKADLPAPSTVVISSLSLLTILNGFVLRKKYGCRLIFEVRDIWPLTIVEEGGFSKHNPFVILLSWVERLGYARSDAIVGTMPNLQEHVQEVLGRQKEVYCIPMGIAEDLLEDACEAPPDYVAKYFPKDKFIVTYAGTIGITNALDSFFECVSAMAGHTQIHFVVVGEGDLRDEYISEYGGLRNLTFAPRVPKAMVNSILTASDILYFSVYPSEVWKYGQSLNKVTDYMAAGRPIIASYSGFPSMINEADCGSFVPANDVDALRAEILRYFEMPESERLRIGERGSAWIRANRNYERLAKSYLPIMLS